MQGNWQGPSGDVWYIEIDVNAIPAEKVEIQDTEKKRYATVRLQMAKMKHPMPTGFTHSVYLYRSKAMRDRGEPTTYVGRAKIMYPARN